MDDTTIIVGAGLGGLSAAIHLAIQGQRVIVFEKNERVGGKLNIVQEARYIFDTGPSLLTMPWTIRETFTAAGRNVEDYLELLPVEPTCRYFWPDNTQFNAWQQLPLLTQEIARLEPADVLGMFRFLHYSAQIYDIVADAFLLRPFDGMRDLITPDLVSKGWKIDAFRSVDTAVRSFFRSPYLQQIFNRYATYNGSSPYLSPATFNVIAYIEFTEGGWYIRGGMYELGRALLRLSQELGVEVHTQTEVRSLINEQGIARGVRLSNGKQIEAAQVVVNADPRYTYAGISRRSHQLHHADQPLLAGSPRIARQMTRLEPSCAGFIILLGINRTYEQLAHHNIFFSQDYPREFAAIFAKGVPAPDPTVYVCNTSLTDPHHAPPGHSNMFILVNAPTLNARVNWDREVGNYRDVILRKLERMGLSDLRRHIVYEQIITPADFEARYNAVGGAIYGLASNSRFAAFLRPPLRARDTKRLYFVGGGTHPGGGIPLALLSGKAVAERIKQDSHRIK